MNMYSKLIILMCLLSVSAMIFGQRTSWGIYTPQYTFEENTFLAKARLEGAEVSGIDTDSRGTVYVGVKGEGVFRLTKDNDKYESLKPPKEIKLYNRNITALVVDTDDRLWVGTHRGLVMYDGNSWVEINKKISPEFTLKAVSELFLAPDGKLYVAGYKDNLGLAGVKVSGGGLMVYDQNDWKSYTPENSDIPYDFVADFAIAPNGDLWMTSGIEDGGLVKFDGQKFTHFNQSNSELPTPMIRDIGIDQQGVVYIGTIKGLYKQVGEVWEKVLLSEKTGIGFADKMDTRLQPDVRSLAIDAKGTMWVGTRESGLYRIKGGRLRNLLTENSPITSNNIREIIADPDGRTWFLTGLKKENLFDGVFNGTRESGYWGAFSIQANDFENGEGWTMYSSETSDLENAVFYNMDIAPNGDLWLAGGATNLTRFDGANWESVGVSGGLLDGLSSLATGADGTIYAGSQLSGLYVYKDGKVSNFNKKNSEINNAVTQLAAAPNGDVWIGNFKGLKRFRDGEVTVFDKKSTGLPSNNINDITVAKDGTLWFASYKGVGRMQGDTWTFWDKKSGGLPGNNVSTITIDGKGNPWIMNNNGVAWFDGTKWQVFKEILGVGYDWTAIAADEQGKVYVGTGKNGLFVFDKGEWTQLNAENSPIYLTEIKSLTASPDGTVWINNINPNQKSSSTPNPVPGVTIKPVDPKEALLEKIEAYDPAGVVISWKQ